MASTGPYVDEVELQKVCEMGYRGEHAKAATEIGRGIGLGLLRAICGYHDVKLQILSHEKPYDFNGIPYGEFTVVLYFKKT